MKFDGVLLSVFSTWIHEISGVIEQVRDPGDIDMGVS
jgi:hypothetical protein